MRPTAILGGLRLAAVRAARAALDFVAPPTCAFCGGVGRDGSGWPVCDGCRDDLPRLGPACPRCARPLAPPSPPGREPPPCGRCQRRPPPFAVAHAPLRYEFPVDAAIRALKFEADLCYAPALADLARPWLVGRYGDWDCLTPVPLNRWREARRGYNQARELAVWLARGTGLPVVELAVRRRRTRPQSGLPAAARRANVRGSFEAIPGRRGVRVLVVDDVMTTGETCRELARVLLAAGVAEVGVLCMARAVPGRALQPGTAGVNV